MLDENDLVEMIHDKDCDGLDFDDTYQYFSAKKYNLTIISFDKDFDKTVIGRKTPEQITLNKIL